MTIAKAKLSHLRISPRKVRLVVDLVRGKNLDAAIAQLMFSPKMAARPVQKLIESATANAVNNFKMDESKLYIAEIAVNEGATIKRIRPRAHGRAASIRKRTSHVTVVLAERGDVKKVKSADTAEAVVKDVPAEKDIAKKPSTKKTVVKKTVAAKSEKESKKPESVEATEKKKK